MVRQSAPQDGTAVGVLRWYRSQVARMDSRSAPRSARRMAHSDGAAIGVLRRPVDPRFGSDIPAASVFR